MAEAKLTAALEAVDNMSKTLKKIEESTEGLGREVESLSNDFDTSVTSSEAFQSATERLSNSVSEADRKFDSLSATLMAENVSMQTAQTQSERFESTMHDLGDEVDSARRAFNSLSITQGVSTAAATTNAGAMEIAGNAIDDMGKDAMKTAGQMGVLNTVMQELSLSGSALSVNIGAFNVSLRNLAPLVPIAASMGSVVTVMGAFITSLGAATVALAGFTAGGAIGFLEDIEEGFAGVNNQAEALQALMGGIGDLFRQALKPLETAEDTEFFINLVEGTADLVNRLAQAIDQMRGEFMPLFSGFADIINAEFDNVANAIQDMMVVMNPVLLNFFEWFMQKLPGALRFMARITRDLAGPIGTLGNSVLDLLGTIIETATQIFQGLAPAFAVALDIATALIDVFNTLSNGAMQAALFLGSLVFAANKFVAIADTMANVGITAANTISGWVGTLRNADSITGLFNSKIKAQYNHLSALGSVMKGNMGVYEASGQLMEDIKDAVQNYAQALENADERTDDLTGSTARLMAVLEGGDIEDATEETTEAVEELSQASRNIDVADSGALGSALADAGDELGQLDTTQVESLDNAFSDFDADETKQATRAVRSNLENMDLSEVEDGTELLSGMAVPLEGVSDAADTAGDAVQSAGDEMAEMPGPDTSQVKDSLQGIAEQAEESKQAATDTVQDASEELAEMPTPDSDAVADELDGIAESGTEMGDVIDDAFDQDIDIDDDLASVGNEMGALEAASKNLDDVDAGGLDSVVDSMDGVSGASDEVVESTDDIVEGITGIRKEGGDIQFFGPNGFAPAIDEADELGKALDGISFETIDTSEIEARNVTELRNELLKSDEAVGELGNALVDVPDDMFGDLSQNAADYGDALESADMSGAFEGLEENERRMDSITEALESGALSAGPGEAIITPETGEILDGADDAMADIAQRDLDVDGSLSAAAEQADLFSDRMSEGLGEMDSIGAQMALPNVTNQFDEAGEAADRMDESLQSMDIAGAFETMDMREAMDTDEVADLVSADLDESLGRIDTEEFFDMADADMPQFDDMADDMSTFNKEFETAMDFDVPFEDVQLEEPWERADAAVQSFDEDMLAMADSADELDLSETMDPIDTSNLDVVKGKLGGLKDSAQDFGQTTSDWMRSAGNAVTDFAVGTGEEVGGAAGSISDGLDTIGGAAKEQAAVMKRSFIQAGGATGIMSSAVDTAKTKLGALRTSAIQAAGSLKVMAFSAWESIKALIVQGGQAAKTALRNWYLAFSQGGVVAGFKAMASSAYGAVAGLVAAGASAIATAASFVAGLIPATLSAGLALNTAFAGIPALLGALVALSAVAVGVLGNMDGVTSGLKGAFDGLKSAIGQIGDALLSVGVPAWNLFIDIIEMALAPFLAIYDGIMLVAEAFGIAGGEGGMLGGIIGGVLDGFSALMNTLGAIFDFVAPAFSFIGDLLYSAFIIPFQILAGTISAAFELLRGLVALAIDKIPFMSELVGGLKSAFELVKNAIAEIPAFMDTVASMIGGTIDAIVGGIQDALEPAVDFINGLIRQANKVPKVDIDTVSMGDLGGGGASEALSGAQTSTQEVRDNVASDEEEPGDDVATEPDVNMSLEDSIENNVEVQADPEDQAQLSRITKDALEEANSFARRQQGGQ